MGATLVEKVIAARSGRPRVSPGDRINVGLDRVFCYGPDLAGRLLGGGGPGARTPQYPGMIVVAQDQFAGESYGARDPALASRLRDLARAWGVGRYYELGRGGIPAVIFPEAGLVRPGDAVAGMDRHTMLFGAIGSLSLVPSGEGFERALLSGTAEVLVPETVRVLLRGELKRWVGGSDVGLFLRGVLAGEDLAGKALEIGGETLCAMEIADRFALAARLIDLDAGCLIFEPDEKARVYARSRSAGRVPAVSADADAEFVDEIEVDCGGVQPQVLAAQCIARAFAAGGKGRSESVEAVRGAGVSHVVIGGCGHGRLDDLRVCAYFLRDYMVADSVRLTVVPGSQQILAHAMEEGLIQILIRAGAHIGVPSCRYMERAVEAASAAKEHCLAAGTCPAPTGSAAARFWTSDTSPALAAVAAVAGTIRTPLDLARDVPRMATGLIP